MSMLIDQQKVLANTFPDPLVSLRSAFTTALILIFHLCLLLIFLPSVFFVILASWIPVVMSMWYLNKLLRHERLNFYNLFVDRGFTVPGLIEHPDEIALRNQESRIPLGQRSKGRWVRIPFPPSEPYFSAVEVTKPDGTTFAAQYLRHRLVSDHAQLCREVGKYLKQHSPLVYKLVSDWWLTQHANPVASQRWMGRTYQDLTPAQQKLVRHDTEVEFLQGCFIALAPDTWGKRFDERPYHVTHYTLRKDLERLCPPKHVPTPAIVDGAPWPLAFRLYKIFQGTGFRVDEEISAQLHYQKFQPRHIDHHWLQQQQSAPRFLHNIPVAGPFLARCARSLWLRCSSHYRNLTQLVTSSAKGTGARWVLGLGWRKLEPVWIDYNVDLMQHSGAGGASGYGKTVLTHGILIAGIYNFSAVVWLDPKWDSTTTDLIYWHAERAGRLDDVVFLSISRGDLPYNSTFNPLAGYFDPSQIGNILAGLMPPDAGSNQAFLEDAKSIGRIVGTLCHWLNHYLAALDGTHDLSARVPRMLLWLEYARLNNLHQLGATDDPAAHADRVEQVKLRFQQLYDRLFAEDRAFKPADHQESVLFRMWLQPEYTPRYWKLHFGHLLEFALNNRQRITSWAMRIVYPHVCASDSRFSDPFFPLTDTLALVSGEAVANPRSPTGGKDTPLIQIYDRSGPHILSPGALLTADRERMLWSHLYEVLLPVEKLGKIQATLEQFSRIWTEQLGQMKRNPDDFANGLFNLRPVITEIVAGRKYDQFCVPDPHITWQKICDEKKIVIFALGSMSDEKASDAVAKGLVQSLIGWIGYNQDGPKKDLDLLFIGDEFFSWATETFANIVDKARSSGVRTFVLCQSEAGARYRLGNDNLWKHITTSQRNRFLCNTNSGEDQEAMLDGLEKRPFYMPSRNVSENPAQGSSGNNQVAEWSTGETWTWSTQELPLIEKQILGFLPKGVFLRRIQDHFHFFQAPQYPKPPVTLEVILGKERIPGVLIAGIDYDVRGNIDAERMKGWGSAERIGVGAKRAEMIHIDSGELAQGQRVTRDLKTGPLQYEIIDALAQAPKLVASAPPSNLPPIGRPPVPEDDLDADAALAVAHLPLPDEQPRANPTQTATSSFQLPEAQSPYDIVHPPSISALPNDAQAPAPFVMPGIDIGDQTASADEQPALADAVSESVTQNVDGTDEQPYGELLLEPDDEQKLLYKGFRGHVRQRVGTWQVLDLESNRVVGIARYARGQLHGHLDRLDASGAVIQRHIFCDGVLIADSQVDPPSIESHTPPPGSRVAVIEVVETDDEGRICSGSLRDGMRIGTWVIKREDATLAEIHHYHMETGLPVGQWERYDELGENMELYAPL